MLHWDLNQQNIEIVPKMFHLGTRLLARNCSKIEPDPQKRPPGIPSGAQVAPKTPKLSKSDSKVIQHGPKVTQKRRKIV